MRVAISTDGEFVSAHFGRCPEFTIVDIESEQVVNREVFKNPGHVPGMIPEYLSKKGVNCIVAGGMGKRAEAFFDQYGIETIIGVTGKVDDAIARLSKGNLESGESTCSPGRGKGYGHDKDCDHPNESHDDEHCN